MSYLSSWTAEELKQKLWGINTNIKQKVKQHVRPAAFASSTILLSGMLTQLPATDIHALDSASQPSAAMANAVVEEAPQGFPEIKQRPEPAAIKTYYSQVTVYHSVPWETDGDPFTTASGSTVRDGILAANCLPFGTLVRMPDLFGNKIFRVEDRLAPRKSCFVLDMWEEYNPHGKSFGAPVTRIEILEGSPRSAFALAR